MVFKALYGCLYACKLYFVVGNPITQAHKRKRIYRIRPFKHSMSICPIWYHVMIMLVYILPTILKT